MLKLLTALCIFSTSAFAADDGFTPLFNGKDLTGWDGDPKLWKVENGIVIGTNPSPEAMANNSFLIWRGGTVKNVELRATVRVIGDNNSGIQYRSSELKDIAPWVITGYQCDIHPAIEHTGMTYEERGRGIFGLNGKNVLLDPEGTLWQLSEHTPVKVDVRVIAATNRNLREMVDAGTFREDLYFRLNVVKIEMPPLRRRREDIILLANSFLAEFAKENQRPLKPLTDEALKLLLAYPWPGNVRELRTAIEHGVVMSNDPQIDTRHLPGFLLDPAAPAKPAVSSKNSLDDPAELNLHVLETNAIRAALAASAGNRTHAAELLGLSRRTLQRKLKELGI